MKRKHLRKVSKNLFKYLKEEKENMDRSNKQVYTKEPMEKAPSYERNGYKKEYSDKVNKLIDRILTMDENLYISISEGDITLRASISSDDSNKSNGNNAVYARESRRGSISDEDYSLSINVLKTGFKISKSYDNSIYFEDPDMYDNILQKCIDKKENITKNRFNTIIDDFLVESRLSRGANIDDLLSDS